MPIEKDKRPKGLFRALADKSGTPPTGILAVPGTWTFIPEECTDEGLLDFLAGRTDSMNAGDDELVAEEMEQARAELRRRGCQVPGLN